MRTLLATGIVMAVCTIAASCLGTTWYVSSSVAESGDGMSWETAFKTVRQGTNAAQEGDTVIVAPGVYSTWTEATSAPGRERGAAGEPLGSAAVALPGKNIVLRSVNPLDPRVVATTILDGAGRTRVVSFCGTENGTCVLSGFTIRNGRAPFAAGIYGSTWGGHTHATIENNVICNNVADADQGGGGGIAFCDGIIRNNVIIENRAEGLEVSFGGGLYDCDGLIESNTIARNSANYDPWTIMSHAVGGALCACDGMIRNNAISRNSAPSDGGALDWCAGTILNNVIVGNSSLDGPGLSRCRGTVANNVIWGNVSPLESPQLHVSSVPTYSCIQDWTGGGEGNISEEPRFVDAENGDFRLLPDSRCVDAGFNDPELPETDIVGMHRIMFGGRSLRVDMGAYEFYINDLTPGPEPHQTTFTWSSLADKTYSIFYTDELLTWHLALSAFPSSGNTTTSWIDDGSLTGLPPSLLPRRFYRILENP